MPGPLKNWRLPPKPIIVVELSSEGMTLAKQSGNAGLIAIVGHFQRIGIQAKVLDYDLCMLDDNLVQVQTVPMYHGWSADIQTGVQHLVLVWPDRPPKFWQIIGWLEATAVTPFPIPHHKFHAFRFERNPDDNGVGQARPNIVRP